MEIVVGLLIVVVAVTVIGHGLWLLCAVLIRAVVGGKNENPDLSALDRSRRDVVGMNRQIGLMLNAGAIDRATYAVLRRNLEGYASRLGFSLPTPAAPLDSPEREFSAPVHESKPAEPVTEVSTPTVTSPFQQPDHYEVMEPTPMAELVDESEVTSEELPARTVLTPAREASPFYRPPTPHPLDRDYSPTQSPRGDAVRSRAFADFLQSFLEERNIRWGELVSGLLIVGSAVGLVVSLRSELSRTIPYFPAILFLGITAAIHGAGMYTLHRWRLPSTSRGLLLIAMLLIPLNATAACLFTERGDSSGSVFDPMFLLAVAVGTSVWSGIAWQAGRALAPGLAGPWTLTVMSGTVVQPFVNRLGVGQPSLATHELLYAVPVTMVLAASAWTAVALRRRLRGEQGGEQQVGFDRHTCERLLMLVGLGAFSLLTALVLAAMRSDVPSEAISRMSPTISIMAAVVIAAGLTLRRRTANDVAEAYRVAGTALMVCGGMAMMAALVTAWPNASLLVATSLANASALAWIAYIAGWAALDAGIVVQLTLALWIVIHHRMGNLSIPELSPWRNYGQAILDGVTGLILMGAGVGLAAVVFAIPRRGRSIAQTIKQRGTHASELLLSATLLVAAATPIAIYSGFVDPRADEVWSAVGNLTFATLAAVTLGVAIRSAVSAGIGGAALAALAALLCVPTNAASQLYLPDDIATHWRVMIALVAYSTAAASLGLAAAWVERRGISDMEGKSNAAFCPSSATVAASPNAPALGAERPVSVWGEPLPDSPTPGLVLLTMAVMATVWLGTLFLAEMPVRGEATMWLAIHAGCAGVVAFVWYAAASYRRIPLGALASQVAMFVGVALALASSLWYLDQHDSVRIVFYSWEVAVHLSFAAVALGAATIAAAMVHWKSVTHWSLVAWRTRWAEVACWIVGLLSTVSAFAYFQNSVGPGQDDWAVASFALILATATLLAATRHRVHIWLGGLYASMVVILIRGSHPQWVAWAPGVEMANLIVGAPLIYSLAWMGANIVRQRRIPTSETANGRFVVTDFFTIVSALLVIYVLAVSAIEWLNAASHIDRTWGGGVLLQTPTGWGLLAVLAFSFGLSSWDRSIQGALIRPYLMLLAGVVLVVTAVSSTSQVLAVTTLLVVSGYLVLIGAVWRRRALLCTVANQVGALGFEKAVNRGESLLSGLQAGFGLIAAAIAFLFVLTLDARELRYGAAAVPLLSAAAVTFMVRQRGDSPAWMSPLRDLAMTLLTLGIVCTGWADLEGHWRPAVLLVYHVRLLMSLCVTSLIVGFFMPQAGFIAEAWRPTFRRTTIATALLGVLTLLAVLGLEMATFDRASGVPLDAVQSGAVCVVLLALMGGLLTVALSERFLVGRNGTRNPAGEADHLALLSLNARKLLVYVAEIVFGLTLLHVYLSMPWLFDFEWRVYWPYIIMVSAFLGATLATICERRGLDVLVDPLRNSFAMLPIIPIVGMWLWASESEYDVLMFIAGVFYLLLASMRQSTPLALLAGACGNAALLAFYGRFDGLSLFDHPQLWLIPPAVSTLVALQWHRDSIDAGTATMGRYACVAVIYFSSTSEILIGGLGQRLWPPMVLALLSVFGVLGGMWLRIRSFLYFGVGFLLLAIMAMVAHAQQAIDHTWPWWAFGISLGVLVLTFFGFFEKKREDVERLIRELRSWQN